MRKFFKKVYWTVRVYYSHYNMALELHRADQRRLAYAYHTLLCSGEMPHGQLRSMLETVSKYSYGLQIKAVYYCLLSFWANFVLRIRIRCAALNEYESEIAHLYLHDVLFSKNPLDNEHIRTGLLAMDEKRRMKLHNACYRWENPFASALDCKCKYDIYMTPGWFCNQKEGLCICKYRPDRKELQKAVQHLATYKPDTFQDFLERAKEQRPENMDVWLECEKRLEGLSGR